MGRGNRRTVRGFTLIELMIVIAIIAIIAAIAIPGLLSSQRASNERNASTSLKTLTSAEADFRANDRDGNLVNDFWTGDVKGLYTMTSAKVRGARGETPIRLIELAVAAADLDATLVPAGGENLELAPFAARGPRAGYWFLALRADRAPDLDAGQRPYREDTGGAIPMGKCHSMTKFGFVAVPASSWSGKYLYLVNENNTIFRRAWQGDLWKDGSSSPTPESLPEEQQDFPDDNGLKSYWSRPC